MCNCPHRFFVVLYADRTSVLVTCLPHNVRTPCVSLVCLSGPHRHGQGQRQQRENLPRFIPSRDGLADRDGPVAKSGEDEKEEGEVDPFQTWALMTARDEQHLEQGTPEPRNTSTKSPKAPTAQPAAVARPAPRSQPVPRAQPATGAQPAAEAQPAGGAQPVAGAQPAAGAAWGPTPAPLPGQGRKFLYRQRRRARQAEAKKAAVAKAVKRNEVKNEARRAKRAAKAVAKARAAEAAVAGPSDSANVGVWGGDVWQGIRGPVCSDGRMAGSGEGAPTATIPAAPSLSAPFASQAPFAAPAPTPPAPPAAPAPLPILWAAAGPSGSPYVGVSGIHAFGRSSTWRNDGGIGSSAGRGGHARQAGLGVGARETAAGRQALPAAPSGTANISGWGSGVWQAGAIPVPRVLPVPPPTPVAASPLFPPALPTPTLPVTSATPWPSQATQAEPKRV